MNKSHEEAKAMLIEVLGMDLQSAVFLTENGITCLEEVAYVPFVELVSIKGLVESKLKVWQRQAREHLATIPRDEGNEGDAQSQAAFKPLKPLAGGSSATVEGNE